MRITKTTINKLFTQIEGCRFESFLQIENWFKEKIGEKVHEIKEKIAAITPEQKQELK